jgi:hypothetical protein
MPRPRLKCVYRKSRFRLRKDLRSSPTWIAPARNAAQIILVDHASSGEACLAPTTGSGKFRRSIDRHAAAPFRQLAVEFITIEKPPFGLEKLPSRRAQEVSELGQWNILPPEIDRYLVAIDRETLISWRGMLGPGAVQGCIPFMSDRHCNLPILD